MIKEFISLGADCSTASYLKEIDLRKSSYPLDWVRSYGKVSHSVMSEFKEFSNSTEFSFPHGIPSQERIDRFLDKLENSEKEIYFVRLSHRIDHHGIFNMPRVEDDLYSVEHDIEDMELLCEHITEKYPKLKYKILFFPSCTSCYNDEKHLTENENLVIISLGEKVFSDPEVLKNAILDYLEQVSIGLIAY